MNSDSDFGQVSINQNMDHPNAKRLPYPSNRLVGVLASADAAKRAIEHLKSEGMEEDRFELFYGEAGAAALHSAHDYSGLLGQLREITGDLGPEPEQSREYEEAIDAGRVLLSVKVSDESQIETSRETLSRQGAQSMRYYGRLAIRELI